LNKSYFLWPENRLIKALRAFNPLITVDSIETMLHEMFPTGFPVLCSSGRAALNIVLIHNEVTRSDYVGVFPYASHCVLDSVSRLTNPLLGKEGRKSSLRIIYHQWSFVQEMNLKHNSIEDCADTICIPGTNLFMGGGAFEIWSLPKILGTTSGGLIWCRDKETAICLRHLRDNRGGGLTPWILRQMSKSYPSMYTSWQGLEVNRGQVSKLQTGEIFKAIQNWDNIISDRLKKIDLVWPYSLNWLKKPKKRLPPVIPIKFESDEKLIKDLGIASGYRMIERINSTNRRSFEKVLPVPIHQDVDEAWLVSLIKNIEEHICI